MFFRPYRLPYSAFLKQASYNRFTRVVLRQINFSIFKVRYQANKLPDNRYGFIIGKRVDKRAVIRNRAKRVLRSEVELLHPNLKQGFDFLFFILQAITKENNKKAREEVRGFFGKEGLID